MADWLKTNVTKYTTAGTTTAGVWPAHESGDLLLVAYLGENNNDDFSDATYTSVGSAAASGGGSANTIAVYRHVATSSSETNPSATHASATNRACIAMVIKNAHATPIDTLGFQSLNSNSSPFEVAAFASGTTSNDNVMCMHFTISDQGASLGLDAGPTQFVNEYVVDGSCEIAAAWTFQKTAGTTPVFNWGMLEFVNNGFTAMVPVRMTKDMPRVDHTNPPADWLFSGAYRNTSGTTGYKPYTVENISTTVATVAGLTTVNGSGTNAQGVGVNPFNTLPAIITSTNDRLGLYGATFPTTDCDGKKILLQPIAVQGLFAARTNVADDHGLVVSLKSSTNEYRWYDAGGKDTRPHELKPVIIDSTAAGIHDENTLDFTDITGVGAGMYRDSAEVRVALDKGWLLNECPIVGGDSDTPATWDDAYVNLQGIDCGSIQKLGNAYETGHDIKVGPAVYFETGGRTLSGMPDTTSTDKRFQAASTSVDLHGISGDTIKINDLVSNLTVTINASSTSAATWDITAPFVGCDVSSAVDIGQISGASFIDCTTFTDDSLDFSGGCIFTNTIVRITGATAAALQTKLDQYANCTIFRLEIASTFAGDIALELTGMTVTTLFYESTQAASELTATLTNSTVASEAVDDDETIDTVAPILTLSMNSDTASTLIRYFENDSQTVADSATGTTLEYEYPDTDVIDIEFVKQNYVPVNRQNEEPYDGNYNVQMDFDEAYNASHGLTITTEFDYNRATKALTINSDQSALDVRSAMADTIRTNSGYYNTPLLLEAIAGLTRVDLIDGATITSMATWKGAGMERFDSADSLNPVEKWFAIKSVGNITGATVHCRQTTSGDSTAITLTNNVIDEAFQYYRDDNHDGDTSDTDEYDYSGYHMLKAFKAGSKQGRVDVPVNAGVSNLSSNLYTVPLANTDHDYAGTDPGITSDITLIAGGTEGGKTFAYEIVDGGTNTGADIADQLNYNAATNPNAVIAGGTGLRYFELPDMVIHNATAVETERGFREGASPTLVGFYVSRGGSDHPDFTRFNADDGTYYVPAVSINITASSLDDDTYYEFYNVTQDALLDGGTVSGGSGASYAVLFGSGEDVEDGDVISLRAAFNDTGTYKRPSNGAGATITAVASSGGVSFTTTMVAWDEVTNIGIDGDTVNEFTYDSGNVDIDLDDGDGQTTKGRLVAWWANELGTANGIRDLWNAYTVFSSANFRQNVTVADVVIHNVGTNNVRFTDNDRRYYRSDNSNPYDTSGSSIFMDYTGVPDVVEIGVSGLTSGESAQLSVLDSFSFTSGSVDSNVKAVNGGLIKGTGADNDPWGPA